MSTTEPRIVTLRTGAEVPEPVLRTTMLTLEALETANPIALFEAAEVALDKHHRPFGNTGEILRGYDLLDSAGEMHGATRDVILAATEASDFDVRLVSPYAEEAAQ